MQSHPDANAFMQRYLTEPADATTRLVFADWLDETGETHNAAWAQFIRLKAEADRHEPGSPERRELDRRADRLGSEIRARLTISASRFVRDPLALMHLLPPANVHVQLADFDVHPAVAEFMPESVARENVLMILAAQGRTLLIAAWNPPDTDLEQKLAFILNRDIILVGGEHDDIVAAIDRNHGISETEIIETLFVEFADTGGRMPFPYLIDDADAPVVRLMNIIIQEAINLRADRVLMYPDLDAFGVRFRIDDAWVERDRAPLRLMRPLTRRLAVLAAIDAALAVDDAAGPLTGWFVFEARERGQRVRVTILPSPDGPTTQLDLIPERPAE